MIRIFDGGLYVPASADPQSFFVANANVVVAFQIVPNATVPFIRACSVNLFGNICYSLVFLMAFRQFSGRPAVVGTSRDVKNTAARSYRISVFFMAVQDGTIQIALSYLRKASLLSSSSSFFNRSRSIRSI